MRKRGSKSFFYLFALLLILMSVAWETSETMRASTIAILAPVWNGVHRFKGTIGGAWDRLVSDPVDAEEELQRLRLQNQLLASENHRLRDLLQADWGGYDAHNDLIPAQVIFRSPSTWNSSLWINVGSETNHGLSKAVIAKNSPVLYGRSLVGVIDYVGARQSRVRLITDSGLTPSVRAMRLQGKKARLLAKGELYGSSLPLWRGQSQLLHGIGFNYDFADEEGPARDLRTGKPTDPSQDQLPIIQVHDLLVTTGMDGVFPPGLEVALVTRIFPLKEGDYYYELEAKPTGGQLDKLSFVFVIPPIGYDPDDQPPPLGN